jgi:hypothetical protein
VLVMVVEPRQAFEVAEVVVERVAVAMVDVMAGRNVAVSHLPNLLMETPNAALAGIPIRYEIRASCPSLGLGVTAEDDAVEQDGFDICHA